MPITRVIMGAWLRSPGTLMAQYRLATGGDELDLFVDKDMRWGEEWEARIGTEIAGTTFFIPIITPTYFRSQACRDELREFSAGVGTGGLQKLVMPIYWRTVPELHAQPEHSPDFAIRLIHKYQWKDLREARLENEESAVFRKALDDLAEELVKRASEAETVEDVPTGMTPGPIVGVPGAEAARPDGEADSTEDDDDELGLIEKLVLLQDALPEVVRILEEIGKEMTAVNDISATANEAFDVAAKRGASAKAGLVVTERFAKELNVPAERLERLASEYAARLVELDTGVNGQLDLVEIGTGSVDPSVREELESTVELRTTVNENAVMLEELINAMLPLARMSRSLRGPIRRLRAGLQGVIDGRETIVKWSERAAEVLEARDRESESEDEDDGSQATP